jgi:hypothetical protein
MVISRDDNDAKPEGCMWESWSKYSVTFFFYEEGNFVLWLKCKNYSVLYICGFINQNHSYGSDKLSMLFLSGWLNDAISYWNSVARVIDEWMTMERWCDDSDMGKLKHLEKNLSACHFVQHKSFSVAKCKFTRYNNYTTSLLFPAFLFIFCSWLVFLGTQWGRNTWWFLKWNNGRKYSVYLQTYIDIPESVAN